MQTTLQRKAAPELYTLAEQIASIQDATPKAFQTIVDKAVSVYLELFHQTEPNLNGDSGDLIEGRAACWPLFRDKYTTEQTKALRIVSLCCLVDTLLSRKRTLPGTLPFVVLSRTLLFCGDRAGFTLPMLQSGLDQLTTELESAAGGGEQHKQDTPPDDTPQPRIEKAYQSYCWAERESGKTKDKEVYEYLKDNPFEEYDLPAFLTWQSSVSRGRSFYRTLKNTPRGGRSIRAPRAKDDPGLLKQVSNQYNKLDES